MTALGLILLFLAIGTPLAVAAYLTEGTDTLLAFLALSALALIPFGVHIFTIYFTGGLSIGFSLTISFIVSLVILIADKKLRSATYLHWLHIAIYSIVPVVIYSILR
jgi:putative effector of murein hydrolase LrgA (UPF0299 family)